MRRVTLGFAAILMLLSVLGVGACSSSSAPKYPEKPINLIVPYPPGGGMDTSARALIEALKPYVPQPITIVNRGGASGTVGTAEVMQAKADGYTIAWTSNSVMAMQPHRMDLPWKAPETYVPITNGVDQLYVLAVGIDQPWNSLADFVNHAKANPGAIRIGGSGLGTIPHMDVELFKERAGINLTFVPFEGDGPASTQLLGGHIEAHMAPPASVLPHVKAGKLKLLAVIGDKRNEAIPDVPTFQEQGVEVNLVARYFLAAPKGTPDYVVKVLDDAMKQALATPEFKKFAFDNMYNISYLSPPDLKETLQGDYAFFGDLVKKLNLK